MINTQYGNYVKFIRGTETLWASIPDSEKNLDTLYFISNTNSTSGKLYLGPKLISNGNLSSATAVKDLQDVLIGEGLTDQSILVYNAQNEKWENKSLLEISLAVTQIFQGATETSDGVAGLVPVPSSLQRNLYLRGDATWADPAEQVKADLSGLHTVVSNFIGEDTDKTARQIARDEASTAVAEVVAGAPQAFDTLKEIAEWIQSNQGSVDVAGLTTRVTTLENEIYGMPDSATAGLKAVISTLQSKLDTVEDTVELHTTDIEEIKKLLQWQDIIEE